MLCDHRESGREVGIREGGGREGENMKKRD
jgi:hypothetical protein